MNGNVAARHDRALNRAAHPVLWPLARFARRVGPVIRVPGVGLVVSDASIAHDALVRDDDFPKNGPGSIAATMTRFLGPAALGNMDGAAHRALRGRVSDLLAPTQAGTLLTVCDAPLAMLGGDLAAGRTVDLARWARIASGRLTFDLLGVRTPTGGEDEACLALLSLGECIASAIGVRPPGPRRARAVDAACAKLTALARHGWDAPDARRGSFVQRLREEGLTFDEARGVLSIILLAGTLTTAAALPRIVALLIDAGQLGALRGCGPRVADAIAEGLRYTAPVPATVRIARRATTLGEHQVAAGTRVVIVTANLARDPTLFPDPDRFDATRAHDAQSRHLWFGAGSHFCLGFAVAQRQLQRTLTVVADAPGTLRIVARHARRGGLLPAYARLDVRAETRG